MYGFPSIVPGQSVALERTVNPFVELESVASLPLSAASGLGFGLRFEPIGRLSGRSRRFKFHACGVADGNESRFVQLVCIWSASQHETGRFDARQCKVGTVGVYGLSTDLPSMLGAPYRSEKPGVGGSSPPLTTTSEPLLRRGFGIQRSDSEAGVPKQYTLKCPMGTTEACPDLSPPYFRDS